MKFLSVKAFTRLHAISGFQYAGLFPLNKLAVDKTKLSIGTTFEEPTSTPAITPAITSMELINESTPAKINNLLDYQAGSLEKAMKSFFQLQNKHSSNGKPKRVNVNFNGECLTNDEVIERVRKVEEGRTQKNPKRKLNFNNDQSQTEANQNEPKKQKLIKCKRCKKEFNNNMQSCETCSDWFCIATCLPKRYSPGTEFYCTKKCKPI